VSRIRLSTIRASETPRNDSQPIGLLTTSKGHPATPEPTITHTRFALWAELPVSILLPSSASHCPALEFTIPSTSVRGPFLRSEPETSGSSPGQSRIGDE
jgi:hypothetical protein